MSTVETKFPPNAFLSDVRVYDVGDDGLQGTGDSPLDSLAASATASGNPEIVVRSDSPDVPFRAAIAFPIYRSEKVVSVVALATSDEESIGVFEVWSPIGRYQELNLCSGYFGDLARFQNVSSFVRFEKGSGLPGQVWNGLMAVIHDDLSNHPGFLRAAGAAADALSTGIGIPVCGSNYSSSVLLISSQTTPMARGFEVWKCEPGGLKLNSCSYTTEELAVEVGSHCAASEGLFGLVEQSGRAVLSSNPEVLLVGRTHRFASNNIGFGIAIPFYESDVLTSVTILLF